MNSVIKSENYRLSRSKEMLAFALVQISIAILYFAFMWSVGHIQFVKNLFGESMAMLASNSPAFFDTFTGASDDMIFRFLLIIMICSLVTKLYQSGVVKQLVSSGIPRSATIIGHFISMTAAVTCVAVITGLVTGLSNVLLGGKFGLTSGDYGRLLLSILGMILSIANMVAMTMLMAHLTGSMGTAIALSLIIELGSGTAVSMASSLLKWDFLQRYFFLSLRSSAMATTGSVTGQLLDMVYLTVYTVIFLGLGVTAFSHKDIK